MKEEQEQEEFAKWWGMVRPIGNRSIFEGEAARAVAEQAWLARARALDAARAREDRKVSATTNRHADGITPAQEVRAETEAPRPHVPVGGLSSAGASGSLPTPPRWFNDYQRREISNIALSEIGQSYGVLRATIADLEGKMLTITGGLHNAIDRVEASIDALARRLTGITAQHAELMGKVTALERGSASGATVRCSRCGLHGPASDADRHARDCDGPPARAKPDPKCMECGETLPFEDGEEHVCAPTRPAPSSGEEDETAEARRRVCSLMREPLNRERSSFEVNQFMVQAEIESACAAARVDERAAALRDARFAVREYEDARRIIGDMLRSLPSAPPAAEAGGREGKRG